MAVLDLKRTSTESATGSVDTSLSVLKSPARLTWRVTMTTGRLDRNGWRLLRGKWRCKLWHYLSNSGKGQKRV